MTRGRVLLMVMGLAAHALLLSGCAPTPTPSQAEASAADAAANHAVSAGQTGQPWAWTGWDAFPSLYFAAEPDGPFTDAQIKKIQRFELAIVEFRTGQFMEETTTGRWAGGDLGGLMDAQAERIQAGGGPPTLVYRNAQWAGTMFKSQRELLKRQDLFLPDGRDCAGFIDYPLDVGETGATTGFTYCRWDLLDPAAREAFLGVVREAANGPSHGVFFDNGHSVACDEAQALSTMTLRERRAFLDAQHDLYREAFTLLETQGKYPVLSTTMGFEAYGAQVPWEGDCPRWQDDLLADLNGVPFARNNEFWMWNLGDLAARQIKNTLAEARRGVPTIVHMPYFPSGDGCLEGCFGADGARIRFTEAAFLEFGVAAFLVAMGPGSYFGFSDMEAEPEGGGWFDKSWLYHPQYDRIVTGRPLGAASVSNDGMTFTRRFERGTVWVNVANGTYALNLEVAQP